MKLTKERRTGLARELIDRQQMMVPFSAIDAYALNTLLGTGFDSFMRCINPLFPSDTRHLHRFVDGKWEPFSWKKCISPISPRQEAHRAMRRAIKQDVEEAREALLLRSSCCGVCGATERLQVDHSGTPFQAIADAFMMKHGPFALLDTAAGMDMEESAAADWIAFHASMVSYELLCGSCNARKGNR